MTKAECGRTSQKSGVAGRVPLEPQRLRAQIGWRLRGAILSAWPLLQRPHRSRPDGRANDRAGAVKDHSLCRTRRRRQLLPRSLTRFLAPGCIFSKLPRARYDPLTAHECYTELRSGVLQRRNGQCRFVSLSRLPSSETRGLPLISPAVWPPPIALPPSLPDPPA